MSEWETQGMLDDDKIFIWKEVCDGWLNYYVKFISYTIAAILTVPDCFDVVYFWNWEIMSRNPLAFYSAFYIKDSKI